MKSIYAACVAAVICAVPSLAFPVNTTLAIINGDPAAIRNHPYQVAIAVQNIFICSGAIVSQNWLVTTATCIEGFGAETLKIRAGSYDPEFGGQVREGMKVIKHPQFTVHNMDNDIALVKVNKPFAFGNKVQPVKVANTEPAAGDKVTVSGWGEDENSHVGAYREIKMQVMSYSECRDEYQYDVYTNSMICTKTGDKSPCWGDFGDPMVNQWGSLVGLYSWTRKCMSRPAVFTNIVTKADWILENTED